MSKDIKVKAIKPVGDMPELWIRLEDMEKFIKSKTKNDLLEFLSKK
tara:strand:+ start:460 stop:597 length:138 start_codon:yes stop_codon:yes gene_type:complete